MDHALCERDRADLRAGCVQSNSKRVTEFVLDAYGQSHQRAHESLLDYIGSGQSTVVALAAGPDGLYFL